MTRRRTTRSLATLVTAALLFSALAGATAAVAAEEQRVFELRTYTAHEGKLEDLHKRFREHTNRLFQKHGMTLVGYWTPVDEPESKNTLVYILAYPSREAREASWKAFREQAFPYFAGNELEYAKFAFAQIPGRIRASAV